MLQPRPTPWGASDGSLAADCLRIGGIAALAADWEDGADSRKHLRGDGRHCFALRLFK